MESDAHMLVLTELLSETQFLGLNSARSNPEAALMTGGAQ